jgi:hypothetical protein
MTNKTERGKTEQKTIKLFSLYTVKYECKGKWFTHPTKCTKRTLKQTTNRIKKYPGVTEIKVETVFINPLTGEKVDEWWDGETTYTVEA